MPGGATPTKGGAPGVGKSLLADVEPHEVRVPIATMTTFALFMLFAPPTIASIYMGFDKDVRYWCGWFGATAVIMPVFLVIQHVLHAKWHEPKRMLVIICVLFPAVFFAAVGGVYMHELNLAATRLYDGDCGTFQEKMLLQSEYDSAKQLYDKCTERLAAQGSPPEPTVETCNEYQEVEARADESDLQRWRYLERVEPQYMCAGFCTGGKSLWTRDPRYLPPCARFMAMKLYFQADLASMTLWYAVAVIVLYFPAHMMMAPFFRTLGYSHSS